ncbi:hypothetical protein OEZ86_013727 [Tetradesmus obliquus]|nr:hypothetical protein OEZ86_013727 [Tetradesmus obliquus]
MFTGATAAFLQGAEVPAHQLQQQLTLTVQWDFMQQLHAQLAAQLQQPPGPIMRCPGGQFFTASISNQAVQIACELNTVLQMNPNRVAIDQQQKSSRAAPGRQLWCESLLSVRSSRGAAPELVACVNARLQEMQAELTYANAQVWAQAEAADAWLNKVGSPAEAAAWLQQDPLLRLGRQLCRHLPEDLAGVKLINLMGSNGTKAVAAALMGAAVTCVDISPSNAQYGQQLAAAAGVEVAFVVSDVLQLHPKEHHGQYDIVLLELGVLHYFVDLLPLMAKVAQLLAPGGRLLLREFHPMSTKLISSKGKKHKVAGDYFSQTLVDSQVAYSKYNTNTNSSSSSDSSTAGRVRLRQWTLGEVVSSVAAAGLVLQVLEEEPGVKLADAGLPKLFTLVAQKPAGDVLGSSR